MKLDIKTLISLFLIILFTDNSYAQKIFFHYNDSIVVSTNKLDLICSVYNETLLKWASEQDSVSIWVLEQDSCQTNAFSGIPWCKDCSVGANLVIQNAYKLSLIDGTVVTGSCWDYLNAVYSRIESESFKKQDLYLTKKDGPYVSKSMLQPGDWVYHVNYQYYNIEHSAIFICWKDYEQGIAITLSYMGMNRWKAAQLGEFNLNSVYAIFRLEDQYW